MLFSIEILPLTLLSFSMIRKGGFTENESERLVGFSHTCSTTASYRLKAEDFVKPFPNLLHSFTNSYLHSVYTQLKY